MGKKMDALLGRTFKTSKFEVLAKLSICRIAILKNHRRARCSHARSDVIELLKLGQHESALLRVEHLIKEQNMLDVFDMIESYCHLLTERIKLIRNKKECPEELKEAISSLLFAAARCGEFPELQEIRKTFISWFGNDFALRAAESHNNFGVNPKMIHKLSARQPSLESKTKILMEISSGNGIALNLEKDWHKESEAEQQEGKGEIRHVESDSPIIAKLLQKELDIDDKQKHPNTYKAASLDEPEMGHDIEDLPEETEQEDIFPESVRGRRKYRDVADAAQEAFESAAYAAKAARAAVELSRSELRNENPDTHNGSSHHSHGLRTS